MEQSQSLFEATILAANLRAFVSYLRDTKPTTLNGEVALLVHAVEHTYAQRIADYLEKFLDHHIATLKSCEDTLAQWGEERDAQEQERINELIQQHLAELEAVKAQCNNKVQEIVNEIVEENIG